MAQIETTIKVAFDPEALKVVQDAMKEILTVCEGIAPLIVPVDFDECTDDESVGWSGDKEIPVTFAQVRAFKQLLVHLKDWK